jgi:DNA-binding NarL/FixJ family response regulator
VESETQIRVMLVDDHLIVREGLVAMLAANPEIKVVAEAASGEEALQLYEKARPDVTLMDVRLPQIDGFETLQRLRTVDRRAIVLMLAGSNLPEEVKRARKMGASGFLSKDIERHELCVAIKNVWVGKGCWATTPNPLHAAIPELTEREFQVLESARRGLSNADIGRVLSISEHTVKSHVKTLLRKFHAADRAEAVARGFELGLLR